MGSTFGKGVGQVGSSNQCQALNGPHNWCSVCLRVAVAKLRTLIALAAKILSAPRRNDRAAIRAVVHPFKLSNLPSNSRSCKLFTLTEVCNRNLWVLGPLENVCHKLET
jgi:hypothetical protein